MGGRGRKSLGEATFLLLFLDDNASFNLKTLFVSTFVAVFFEMPGKFSKTDASICLYFPKLPHVKVS